MTSLQQEPSAHRPWAKTILAFGCGHLALFICYRSRRPGHYALYGVLVAGFATTPQRFGDPFGTQFTAIVVWCSGSAWARLRNWISPQVRKLKGSASQPFERRPGRLSLRRAFSFWPGCSRRAGLSTLAGGGAFGGALSSAAA